MAAVASVNQGLVGPWLKGEIDGPLGVVAFSRNKGGTLGSPATAEWVQSATGSEVLVGDERLAATVTAYLRTLPDP